MATASDLSPSAEKAFYMRVQALLVDGGTLVLRNLITTKYPGTQWTNHLNKQHIRAQIVSLKNRKVISQDQYDLLYPVSGTSDPSKYDISLMVCLLRNICGLYAQSPVWTGVPASMDHSEEADIRRLNIHRNKMAHITTACLSQQEFQNHWLYIEETLLRLGTNIPDLQQHIDNLKQNSIDPEKEAEMKVAIDTWEKLDKALQEDIEQMKSTVKEHQKGIEELKHATDDLKTTSGHLQTKIKENKDKLECVEVQTSRIQHGINVHEQQIQGLDDRQSESEKKHDELEKRVNKSDVEIKQQFCESDKRIDNVNMAVAQTSDEINQLRKQQEKQMSTELKNISTITDMFLEDSLPSDVYVETRLHREAKEKLTKNNVVVLSGHPGEGKTTMAIKLMLEVSSRNKCLKLSLPSDWRHVDFQHFDTIFIDDIFGPGVIDENLVKDWDKCLPEVWKAVQKKTIKVVIATRHYILEEARQIFQRSSIFKDEHVQFLSSNELSDDERTEILSSHFRANNIDEDDYETLIEECVAFSTSFLERIFFGQTGYLFGFPECVNMFVRNEDLFQRGSAFFQSPNEFFRNCLEDLRKDEEKFLALAVIWTRQDKKLLNQDLELSSTSEEITVVLKKFGFKLKGKLLKTLKKSLKHHENGFLQYSPSTGSYRFSHNVINDMVGLVISEDFPEACLDFTDKDFFMEFITIDKDRKGRYHFFVEEYLYDRLIKTCLRLSSNASGVLSLVLVDRLSLKRGGRRPNEVFTSTDTDASVFFNSMFSDKRFACKFVDYLLETDLVESMITKPMMEMAGYFLSYGFELQTTKLYLPTYSLFHTRGVMFNEFLRHGKLSSRQAGEIKEDMYMAMLIAAHRNQKDVVRELINHGAEISEEAIYVAALSEHTEILSLLINESGGNVIKLGKYEHGNNALIDASKKGLAESVRLLVKRGELGYRNDAKVSALEKAVLYEKLDVARVLIENGAPINEKSMKFKRTPLHIACDMGQVEIVEMLLKAGARIDLKDHRGHYPIHCAAIRNHVDIVKMLALYEPKQVTWRISSYGKASIICGMTVFHVAVWKNFVELMKVLLSVSHECNVRDWYGRTPIYRAVFEGKLDVFKLLLPIADVKQPEKHGYTPLHAAIHKMHGVIIDLLVPESDVNARDKFGKTPLHTACRRGLCDVVRALLERGADPNIITKSGDSVFMILADHFIPVSPLPISDALLQVSERFGIDVTESIETDPKVDFDECFRVIQSYSPELLQMALKLPNKYGRRLRIMNSSD